MSNPYFIQLIGIGIVAAGLAALTAASHLFGVPLSHDEKRRLGKTGNAVRLPINLETLAAAVVFLCGLGVLSWSNFEACAFLNYWLPSLSSVYKVLLACR
jgi:hypothetical protein